MCPSSLSTGFRSGVDFLTGRSATPVTCSPFIGKSTCNCDRRGKLPRKQSKVLSVAVRATLISQLERLSVIFLVALKQARSSARSPWFSRCIPSVGSTDRQSSTNWNQVSLIQPRRGISLRIAFPIRKLPVKASSRQLAPAASNPDESSDSAARLPCYTYELLQTGEVSDRFSRY